MPGWDGLAWRPRCQQTSPPHWLRGLHAVQLRNSLPHSFSVLGLITLCHAMPRAKCENHYKYHSTRLIDCMSNLFRCSKVATLLSATLLWPKVSCPPHVDQHEHPWPPCASKKLHRSRAAAEAFLYEACASHLFEHETCRPRVQKSGTQNALLQKAYGAKVFPGKQFITSPDLPRQPGTAWLISGKLPSLYSWRKKMTLKLKITSPFVPSSLGNKPFPRKHFEPFPRKRSRSNVFFDFEGRCSLFAPRRPSNIPLCITTSLAPAQRVQNLNCRSSFRTSLALLLLCLLATCAFNTNLSQAKRRLFDMETAIIITYQTCSKRNAKYDMAGISDRPQALCTKLANGCCCGWNMFCVAEGGSLCPMSYLSVAETLLSVGMSICCVKHNAPTHRQVHNANVQGCGKNQPKCLAVNMLPRSFTPQKLMCTRVQRYSEAASFSPTLHKLDIPIRKFFGWGSESFLGEDVWRDVLHYGKQNGDAVSFDKGSDKFFLILGLVVLFRSCWKIDLHLCHFVQIVLLGKSPASGWASKKIQREPQ